MDAHREDRRLAPHPSQLIDRSKTVEFEFDGSLVQAYEGDTVASALCAGGTRVLSRSFKYHRPRGLLCGAGRCPNCLVAVDGTPNVRACTTPVRQGMKVRHQNAWPSLRHDVFSVLDRLHRLLPVGFYYKALHRPKLLWRLAQPIIRRVAGLGRVNPDAGSRARYRHAHRHSDVAVAGGGPAGLSAALAAAQAGASVILIDDQASLGGHLRFDGTTHAGVPGFPESAGFEIAARLAESARSTENIEILSGATAFGLYQDNLLAVLCADELVKVRAGRVVIATGAYETPMVFERNDLPGVMLASAALRLIALYGVAPGTTAVVATDNDTGYHAAEALLDAGVRVAAIVDSRPAPPVRGGAAEALSERGVPVLASHSLTRADGAGRVKAAVVARLAESGSTGDARRIKCDLICMAGRARPADELLRQADSQVRFDPSPGVNVRYELPSGLAAAGDVTGVHDLAISLLQGRLAGLEAAAGQGHDTTANQGAINELRRELATAEQQYRADRPPAARAPVSHGGKKRFVCFCEDLTHDDIVQAVDEGFEDIQTLKRYSTATMGPCQGKMCHGTFAQICAWRTGSSLDEVGATTARPPSQPVPLGALAGPLHLPIKRTPMHRSHLELGAAMTDVGPWRRPHSYGSPADEARAVRERVGIIDVSTLGKLDVRGRDAAALLDRVYTHRFSNLRVGRIRYGLMCSDDGTILDDGTVTRLADDRFFVTTTSGNVEAIEEWFKWWMAGTEMSVNVTNVTSAFAAINVAGPSARDTLGKLTDIDLETASFRYMRSGQGAVAGVPAILLRIGFVGETGWEVHFPAEYGEYLWDALMEAGAEFGIVPFGVEAQRILRLEKKHIIIGQDTDAVSNPLEGDMSWAVRFDKHDFIGKPGLLAVQRRGLRNMLVGFTMRDGAVPGDGDPVVVDGAPAGHVTSARVSPTLGRGFGLAWVPIELAREGAEIRIRVDASTLPASVTLRPVYDPDGARLRE